MRQGTLPGFSLVEVLIAISILIALFAIGTPVYLSARAEASKSNCVSNLRQIGMAIHLYRVEYGGDGVYGDPDRMGLPRMTSEGFKAFADSTTWEVWKCRNQRPAPSGRIPLTSYIRLYPSDPESSSWVQFGLEAERLRDAIILFVDDNHMSAQVVHSPLYPKFAIGLRLDGAVKRRTRIGALFTQDWWQD